MTELFRLCGFGVAAALLCLTVKQVRPDSAVFVSIAAGAAILIVIVEMLAPSISAIARLSEKAELGGFAEILLKALAIVYITSLSADTARDAGENALASKLELGGRAAIAALSLPVFTQLAELAISMLN